MRRFVLGVLTLLIAAVPAQAQDFKGWADYQGSHPINTPFFDFKVWNSSNVLQGNWDMICVDAGRTLNTSKIAVEFWSLSNLSGSGLMGPGGHLGYDLRRLQKTAFIYNEIKKNKDYQGSTGAQYAIWFANGTLDGRNPDNLSEEDRVHFDTIRQAVATAFGGDATPNLDFSNYYLMVARRNNGGVYSQPQLTYQVGVPEPGTTALMAVGILALGVVGVRRRDSMA